MILRRKKIHIWKEKVQCGGLIGNRCINIIWFGLLDTRMVIDDNMNKSDMSSAMTEESTLMEADRAVRARLRPVPCGDQVKFPLEPLR